MARRRATLETRLKAIKSTEDPDELVAALGDPAPAVVEAAAKRISQPMAAGALARAFFRLDEGAPASDPGCWARMAILEALSRLDALEGEEVALRAIRSVQVEPAGFGLSDTATGLRAGAAGVLGNLRPRGALLDLAWLLNDDEPNAPCSHSEAPYAKLATRVAAARAIGALGDPSGAALLAVKLAFPHGELPEVLTECMDGLVALREPRTVELLRPYLAHRDPYLVASAATAIAAVGGSEAVPILVAALDEVMADAWEAMIYAIASIRADAAVDALRALTHHDEERIQKIARTVLGER